MKPVARFAIYISTRMCLLLEVHFASYKESEL